MPSLDVYGTHLFDASMPDLAGKHWPETVPAAAYGLVADIDAMLLQ